MTPPIDSLEAALRAVPTDDNPDCCYGEGCTRLCSRSDYPALAAAAREWIQRMMPLPFIGHAGGAAPGAGVYNLALADVARRLGL